MGPARPRFHSQTHAWEDPRMYQIESNLPDAVVVDIVERSPVASGPGTTVVPNDIRINGQPVLMMQEHPVKVHEVELNGDPDLVYVTLTLPVRRLRLGHEDDLNT